MFHTVYLKPRIYTNTLNKKENKKKTLTYTLTQTLYFHSNQFSVCVEKAKKNKYFSLKCCLYLCASVRLQLCTGRRITSICISLPLFLHSFFLSFCLMLVNFATIFLYVYVCQGSPYYGVIEYQMLQKINKTSIKTSFCISFSYACTVINPQFYKKYIICVIVTVEQSTNIYINKPNVFILYF